MLKESSKNEAQTLPIPSQIPSIAFPIRFETHVQTKKRPTKAFQAAPKRPRSDQQVPNRGPGEAKKRQGGSQTCPKWCPGDPQTENFDILQRPCKKPASTEALASFVPCLGHGLHAIDFLKILKKLLVFLGFFDISKKTSCDKEVRRNLEK